MEDADGWHVQVVLVDLELPERRGLTLAREARTRFPQCRVLMTGCGELESDVIACIEAGASGLVPRGTSLEALIDSLVAVAQGKAICSPEVIGLLFSRLRGHAEYRDGGGSGGLIRLTPRELEILELIDGGSSNKEIAKALGIRLQTVKNHVHNVLEKLDLQRRDQAARFARAHGLLTSHRRPAVALRRAAGCET